MLCLNALQQHIHCRVVIAISHKAEACAGSAAHNELYVLMSAKQLADCFFRIVTSVLLLLHVDIAS